MPIRFVPLAGLWYLHPSFDPQPTERQNMRDKHGTEIRSGDILRYQETVDAGEDYGKSIDEVVIDENGVLCGVQRIGLPRWTTLEGTKPVPLRHYTPHLSDTIKCVEIIGNVEETPERMTINYAHQIFIANSEMSHVRKLE
jgi:hypothetical protein